MGMIEGRMRHFRSQALASIRLLQLSSGLRTRFNYQTKTLHSQPMGKKTTPSTPSSPRKKRKIDDNQQSLDHYFVSRSQPALLENDGHGASLSPHGKSGGRADRQPNSRVIDIEHSQLDARADGRQRNLAPRQETGQVEVEIIDVDLLGAQETLDNVKAEHQTRSSSPILVDSDSGTSTPSPGPSRRTHKALATQHGLDQSDAVSFIPPVNIATDPVFFSVEQEAWSHGTAMPYAFLAYILLTLSGTRSRISILNTLTNAFRLVLKFDPNVLSSTIYLLSNTLSPSYESVELGLGPSIISKAIQQVSGLTPSALKRLYNTTGDPGDVAFAAKSNLRTLIPHPPLRVHGVFSSLIQISHTNGPGAARQKQRIVENLLIAARGEETRFLVRTLCQNLRVGAVRTSIITALARAVILTPPSGARVTPDSLYHVSTELLASIAANEGDIKSGTNKKKAPSPERIDLNQKFASAETLLKQVFVQHPNFDHISAAILETGLDHLLDKVPISVGIPLHPTLGFPCRSLEEVYKRLRGLPFIAEFKYDGQRAQIHAWKNDQGEINVQIFSRHLEDMTSKYPDVVHLAQSHFTSDVGSSSFILDAEIVAIDPSTGQIKPFQELSGRARKDVELRDVKVTVAVYIFDLMLLDNKALLLEPFSYRRTLLHQHFPISTVDVNSNGFTARLCHVEFFKSSEGPEAMQEFWEKAVESRCEGLMIKLLDGGNTSNVDDKKARHKPLLATYEPDKRTTAWLKLKKDYVAGIGDSLDLVPVGAWHGNGRKAQWWSPILLAITDPSTGALIAVCKCMSGFTDAFYKSMKERYSEDSDNCSRQPIWGGQFGGYNPAVYFRPHEVWEIRGADVTLSPVSNAAMGQIAASRGLSLRFPRFIRARDDKSIEQASTVGFLVNIYRQQQNGGKETLEEDDLIDVGWESEAFEVIEELEEEEGPS